jgi:putative transposase
VGIDVEVVYPWWRQLKRNVPHVLESVGNRAGFHVLHRRWVVEGTQSQYLLIRSCRPSLQLP